MYSLSLIHTHTLTYARTHQHPSSPLTRRGCGTLTGPHTSSPTSPPSPASPTCPWTWTTSRPEPSPRWCRHSCQGAPASKASPSPQSRCMRRAWGPSSQVSLTSPASMWRGSGERWGSTEAQEPAPTLQGYMCTTPHIDVRRSHAAPLLVGQPVHCGTNSNLWREPRYRDTAQCPNSQQGGFKTPSQGCGHALHHVRTRPISLSHFVFHGRCFQRTLPMSPGT